MKERKIVPSLEMATVMTTVAACAALAAYGNKGPRSFLAGRPPHNPGLDTPASQTPKQPSQPTKRELIAAKKAKRKGGSA